MVDAGLNEKKRKKDLQALPKFRTLLILAFYLQMSCT